MTAGILARVVVAGATIRVRILKDDEKSCAKKNVYVAGATIRVRILKVVVAIAIGALSRLSCRGYDPGEDTERLG